jgi:hypothetical protein
MDTRFASLKFLSVVLLMLAVAACSSESKPAPGDSRPDKTPVETPDTGTPDSRTPDSGTPDTAPPDSAVADAAPPDVPQKPDSPLMKPDTGIKKDTGIKRDLGPGRDLPSGTATETVTCQFKNSTSTQTCYSSTSHSCSGVTSCAVKVSGRTGTAVTWKSSCGGYAYTTIDGRDEIATFTCKPAPPDSGPPPRDTGGIVTEIVTCNFAGSSSTQTCYSSTSHTCSGVTTCSVKMSGTSGTAVTWKSSCGGYAYTTLDGKDEIASFSCGP